MQDYTFDDCDYTLCKNCHSSIQPYNNMSITTMNVSIKQLASTNLFTKTLLDYNSLHCSKCGLYIKIHPKYNDQTSIQKIFICSNNNPHKYCLCYHCGLLYGINPNQKSIDILNIIHNKLNKINHNINHKEEEECSLEMEVIDDNDQDCSDDEDDENEKNKMSKIDESYLHLIALQTKLNLLSNGDHKSCPSSPNIKSLRNWNLSHSLRGSPLFGPSTPSPRMLGKDVDESEKKWQQYLLQVQQQNKHTQDESTDIKLEKQQKKLEELQKLQKELSQQKKNSEQYAKLFRDGIYSKETGNKMTNFKFEI